MLLLLNKIYFAKLQHWLGRGDLDNAWKKTCFLLMISSLETIGGAYFCPFLPIFLLLFIQYDYLARLSSFAANTGSSLCPPNWCQWLPLQHRPLLLWQLSSEVHFLLCRWFNNWGWPLGEVALKHLSRTWLWQRRWVNTYYVTRPRSRPGVRISIIDNCRVSCDL